MEASLGPHPADMGGLTYRTRLTPDGVGRALGLVIAGLLALHLGLQAVNHLVVPLPELLTDLFHVDVEESVPTWYSSLALLLAAGLLHAGAREVRARGEHGAGVWYALSAGFLLLSLDEVAGLHETLNTVIPTSWVVPAAVLVSLLAVALAPFLRALPADTRWRFALAGVLFVSGALGVEHLSTSWLRDHWMDSMGYALWTAAEEGLEMTGVVLFIHALLRHFEARAPSSPPCAGGLGAG